MRTELYNRLKVEDPKEFTVSQLCELLQKELPGAMPCIAYPGQPPVEVMPMLDYMLPNWDHRKRPVSDLAGDKDYYWIEAVVETGGSEGVYLSVRLCTMQGNAASEKWPIITAKTLEEGPVAYAAMGTLGGVVTDILELFLRINY